MTKNELQKVAEFLEELSVVQGNAGCNDYEMENTDENWNLLESALRWNSSDPAEWGAQRPPLNQKILTYDFLITGYLKHLILQEVKTSP